METKDREMAAKDREMANKDREVASKVQQIQQLQRRVADVHMTQLQVSLTISNGISCSSLHVCHRNPEKLS